MADTELEAQFRKMCEHHDLTYTYSDDGRAYRAGAASLDRVKEFAKKLPREDAVRIWNEVVDTKIAEGYRAGFHWSI